MQLVYLLFLYFLFAALIRDWLFRFFFIYPKTDWSGKFARKIEERDILKWVSKAMTIEKPEVAFVGNSHVMDGIDPDVVSIRSKRTCYNLALYFLPTSNMLSILDRAECYPPVIFIDFSTRYSMYEQAYESKFVVGPQTSLSKRLDTVLDKIAFLMPSAFIPKEFSQLTFRCVRKLREWKKNGYPSVGRYTPFSRQIGFQWKLNKQTNHRFVMRIKPKSRAEKLAELRSLRKSMKETKELCSNDDERYKKSLHLVEQYIANAKKAGSKIILMRLPLDQSLVEVENRHCPFFFDDIKGFATKYQLMYLDLTHHSHREKIGCLNFYIDGQHLEHKSSEKLSEYLTQFV